MTASATSKALKASSPLTFASTSPFRYFAKCCIHRSKVLIRKTINQIRLIQPSPETIEIDETQIQIRDPSCQPLPAQHPEERAYQPVKPTTAQAVRSHVPKPQGCHGRIIDLQVFQDIGSSFSVHLDTFEPVSHCKKSIS
jgi:hypothetical protein